MQALVTGATGFIGSHLVEALLAKGWEVRALARATSDRRWLQGRSVVWVEGDLGDGSGLAEAVRGVDLAVHAAGLTKARSGREYFAVNARGTERLVRACLEASPRPRRLLYVSSLAAVGPSDGAGPVAEEDPPRPLTAYGESKLQGEAAALQAAGPLEVVIVRPPAIYGPRDRDILQFFRWASRGIVPLVGAPNRRLAICHVDDLVRALVLAADRPAGGGRVYHVAGEADPTWAEIGRAVARAVGGRARLVRVPVALFWVLAAASEAASALRGRAALLTRDKVRAALATWTVDSSRAKRELGYAPAVPLAEGMRTTAAWYRKEGWL